jgi:hypothetical protein
MQRRMYHRFDGYEKLKPLLEGSDGDVLREFEGLPVLIRIPAASTTETPKARFVSCLLHGNEPSGFQAMVEVLRRGERFPFDLWVLIGNVRAATEQGLYAHRHLDDQEDFNRVWGLGPADTDQRRAAAAILAELRDANLEAAVDIHNNSGRNPFYAILTQLTPAGRRLAALCADTALLWRLRAHTLMEALAPLCPAVSVECGAPHGAGTAFASGVVHRFLTADDLSAPEGVGTDGLGADPALTAGLMATGLRVTVRPEVRFSFGTELADGDDLAVVPELDRFNFQRMPALETIGRVAPGSPMPFCATDNDGADLTDRLLRITPDGRVVVIEDVVPLMMTTTVVQTRRDCLFYTGDTVG